MLRLGRREFDAHEPVIMAIVNRTPDSFYDQGATFRDEPALARVEQAVSEGAAIIDIGGVKAGPGEEVTAEEEARRTVGFVAEVRRRFPDVVISVDTWRHRGRRGGLRGLPPTCSTTPGAGSTRAWPRWPPGTGWGSYARTPGSRSRARARTGSPTTT